MVGSYGETYSLTRIATTGLYRIGLCCYPATQEVWDSITDAFDIYMVEGRFTLASLEEEPYGKYKIPIKITNEGETSNTAKIYLDTTLKDGEYIDFKTKTVVRADGTIEDVELPEISTFEDYTKIEVLTEVKPSKIVVEYTGYTLD